MPVSENWHAKDLAYQGIKRRANFLTIIQKNLNICKYQEYLDNPKKIISWNKEFFFDICKFQ